MSKQLRGVVAVLAAALLTGCGGGTDSGKSSSPPPPGGPSSASQAANLAEPCSLLSTAAVGTEFSISKVTSEAKPPQTASNGLLTYQCEYRAEVTNTSLGTLSVTSTDGSVTPAEVVKAWLALPNAHEVIGVGDAAVFSLDEPKKVAMFAAAKATGGKTAALIYAGSVRATEQMLSSLVKQAIDPL
jgi:hypothetical protein